MVNTEKSLEFDKIKERWAGLALTDWAKKEIHAITPYLAEGELLARLKETTQAKKMLKSLREDAAHCTLPEKWECMTRCF